MPLIPIPPEDLKLSAIEFATKYDGKLLINETRQRLVSREVTEAQDDGDVWGVNPHGSSTWIWSADLPNWKLRVEAAQEDPAEPEDDVLQDQMREQLEQQRAAAAEYRKERREIALRLLTAPAKTHAPAIFDVDHAMKLAQHLLQGDRDMPTPFDTIDEGSES